MTLFSIVFILLLFIDCALKYYLNQRQISAINRSFNQVPAAFHSQISLEEHHKAGRYSLAKLNLGKIELIYGVILVLIFK